MAVEVFGLDLLAGRGGANYTEDISPTLVRGDRTTHGVVYAIDQQGGKGQANFAEDVMPTLCSDSHGTPHAVAYDCLGFDWHHSNMGVNDELEPTLHPLGTGSVLCK